MIVGPPSKICNNKILLFLLLLQLASTYTYGERIYSVVFNQLPQDYQLYPRDENSEANVPVSGIIEVPGYNYMSVVVYRNDKMVKYLRAPIQYQTNGHGTFATATKIKAELADYRFMVYAYKSGDSVLLADRQNVVSGDAYLLTGQSNSTGFFIENETSKYCRSFGKITGNLNTDPYNPADTLWALANQQNSGAMVGAMGLELQKQLVERSGIPICLINGGFHWSSAYGHAQRTESNPADLNNGYGRMLYRSKKAGLANAIKGFIFRQGESEAYHEGSDWDGNFDRLRKNLYLDYPNLKKLYVFQIDIIFYNSLAGTLIRDYQRRLSSIYPDVTAISTVGTAGFDGLHYDHNGYKQNGLELSRLIARDFYELKDTLNINSPNVQRAFYSNQEKKQLIISFDEDQELVYPEPYKPDYSESTLHMKDFFYLNDYPGAVLSGRAEGNRVILELNGTQSANQLNYLPNYIEAIAPLFRYTGPYLKNKLGMRAFSFFHVPIGNSLATPSFSAKSEDGRNIDLTWNEVVDATGYILERKNSKDGVYQKLTTLPGTAKNYKDNSANNVETIYYRIKAISSTGESAEYAYAEIKNELILGVEEENRKLFSVYPNPAHINDEITVRFKQLCSGKISLISLSGTLLYTGNVNQKDEVTISTRTFFPSVYLIKFESGDRSYVSKVLVR